MSRLLFLLAIPACMNGMTEASSVEQGACVALQGRRFSSVNELECGPTPDGLSHCKWQLSFTASDSVASEFTWFYSDIGEVGRATCHDNTITAVGAREITGTFDPIAQRLMWAGEAYDVVSP